MDRATSDAVRDDRVARWSATLASTGLAYDLMTNASAMHWPQIAAIAVTGITAVWLWLRRGRASQWSANVAILVVNAAVIASLWVSSQRAAESGINWVPFRPHHLGVLAVALLAPSRTWVGVVTIVGFTTAALVQFAMFAPDIRARLPYGDPEATLAFGGFAIGLLIFRLRGNRIEQASAIAHARVAELERFTRTMLAVRDLTNTPLQTLELLAGLVRAQAAHPDDVADRIERAVSRMKEIERFTNEYQLEIEWEKELVAFDPRQFTPAVHPRWRERTRP